MSGSSYRMNYHEFVQSRVKAGEAIVAEMTPDKADAWHAITGISGEAGELVDAVKRWVIYNKPLDRENVIEELGDLEFFLEQLRQRLNITRTETISANIKKLSKRYTTGSFSNEQAQARADKKS